MFRRGSVSDVSTDPDTDVECASGEGAGLLARSTGRVNDTNNKINNNNNNINIRVDDDDDTDVDLKSRQDRQALCLSLTSLILSIPALIGG